MKYKLIIEPQGGLANRMRVLASAYQIVGFDVSRLVCVWKKNAELGAYFTELFEDVCGLHFAPNFAALYSTYQTKPVKRIISKLFALYHGVSTVLKNKDVLSLLSDKTIVPYLQEKLRHGNVYISTCEELCYATDFSLFTPHTHLLNRVNVGGGKYLGIHIRRTDNVIAIERSPLVLFEEVIRNNPDQSFYIATDDYEVEDILREKFGDRMIIREKELARNTLEGMQDAVIDIYSLSKAEKIYGSYWSSFSDIASRIGCNELVVLKQ